MKDMSCLTVLDLVCRGGECHEPRTLARCHQYLVQPSSHFFSVEFEDEVPMSRWKVSLGHVPVVVNDLCYLPHDLQWAIQHTDARPLNPS